MSKETGVREIAFPNGNPKGVHAFLNAKLHGPSLVLNEDGSRHWAADYCEGALDGALWLWGQGPELTLFAEFVRGRRAGIVCLFRNGMPWLIQEWDKNRMTGEYLVTWNAAAPTVRSSDKLSTPMETAELAEAVALLAALDAGVNKEETEIKRDLSDWFRDHDRQIKRQRAAELNLKKRGEMLGAIAARGAATQAAGTALRDAWRRANAPQ